MKNKLSDKKVRFNSMRIFTTYKNSNPVSFILPRPLFGAAAL